MQTKFQLGDVTKDIWAGDLVSTCEFVADIGEGRMIFYDTTFECFRRVFWENKQGNWCLNGWKCASTISELLK